MIYKQCGRCVPCENVLNVISMMKRKKEDAFDKIFS
jgi:hypothetical protein